MVGLDSVLLRNRWLASAMAMVVGGASAFLLLRGDARVVIALILTVVAGLAVFLWPRATVLFLVAWLPFQEMVRRMLIPAAGWSPNDPILLFVPAVVGIYCLLHPVFRKPWNDVTRWMVVVLAVACVQAVSPMGAGVRANLIGALFVVIPLLWFFVGRTVDARTIDLIVRAIPFLGIIVGAYGMYQFNIGFLPWDKAWVHVAGYAALYVGGFVRPFATFASSAEYETFVLIAALVSFALAFRLRGVAAMLYGALGVALWAVGFLDGSRTGMVYTAAGVGILWAYRVESRRYIRLIAAAIGTVVIYLAVVHGHHFASGGLGSTTRAGQMFSHQMSALSQPFKSKTSTLTLHLYYLGHGLLYGLRHPLGEGLGLITPAGGRFGHASMTTELDYANFLIAGGIIGGLAYMWVILLVAYRSLTQPSPLSLAAYVLPAILLLTNGEWMNGGYYFISALIWLLIGSLLGPIFGTGDAVAAPKLGSSADEDVD